MVRNHGLHLPVVVVVALTAIAVVPCHGDHSRYVELIPHKNFSMACDKIWLPVCAKCSDEQKTFSNYCMYYTARLKQDDTCTFQHFDTCPQTCIEGGVNRKLCSRKPAPICARCGFEDLSFLNECEYNNYQCLFGNPCEKMESGYCKTDSNKVIYQKFFEKSRVYKDTMKKISVFDIVPPKA